MLSALNMYFCVVHLQMNTVDKVVCSSSIFSNGDFVLTVRGHQQGKTSGSSQPIHLKDVLERSNGTHLVKVGINKKHIARDAICTEKTNIKSCISAEINFKALKKEIIILPGGDYFICKSRKETRNPMNGRIGSTHDIYMSEDGSEAIFYRKCFFR